MPVVEEILKVENDGRISFGNYLLEEKTKLTDYEYNGFVYKVKTFKELTKLERDGELVYESVPGTSVFNFTHSIAGVEFDLDCESSAQITIELEEDSIYRLYINGESHGTMDTGISGKLTFNIVNAHKGTLVDIKLEKVLEED